MNNNLSVIAGRLRSFYLHLEGQKNTGADWKLARMLEGRIGSGQPIEDDVERAEGLLTRQATQWISRPAFSPAKDEVYEVSFGEVEYNGEVALWMARIRIDGISRNQWIDLDNGLPLDPDLAKYVVQFYRPVF